MDKSAQQDISLLLTSGQFEPEWYSRRYPDVILSGITPVEHYLWLGKRLGRRGRPGKNEDELIDIQAFGPVELPTKVTAVEGQAETPIASRKKNISKPEVPLFNRIAALADWPGLDCNYVCYQLKIDVETDRKKVASLYYEAVHKKNILPNAFFDPEYYIFMNDLDFKVDPIFHYINLEEKIDIHTHKLFDIGWYLEKYPDAKNDPIVHYWNVGHKERVTPINPERVNILDAVQSIFFSDLDEENVGIFDSNMYRQMNPDLDEYSDDDLFIHFEKSGKAENRRYSPLQILRENKFPCHCFPIDFNPAQYVSLHSDLQASFTKNPWQSLSHYILAGFHEGRIYNFNNINHIKPLEFKSDYDIESISREKIPLCVLVHLYYPDMWNEIKTYIQNIDVQFDLYINFVESTWMPSILSQVREDFPFAIVKISPNEGRDIGGFFSLLKTVDFSKYVSFVLLHSKKSPHVTRDYAAMWKKNLFGAILGTREIVRENMAAFLADDEIGIIGSIQTRHIGLENNTDGMRRLFDIYNIKPEFEDCEYVSGTMMMVRSEVMKAVYEPLANHNFLNGDNKGLEHHMDGQIEHSVERIFGNVMRQMNYRFLWR